MGSTFVMLSGHGFWMRDSALELWLRLLALHLEEPSSAERTTSPVLPIRDQWLLASRGYFTGCVPVHLDEAVATPQGKGVVLAAIASLLSALQQAGPVLDSRVLNVLGMDSGLWTRDGVDCAGLLEVGQAFLALIEGRLTFTPADNIFIPKSLVPGARGG